MQKELTTKINNLQSRIENVSNNLLGKPDITIIAVSKKKTAEHIKSAYEIGIRDFGEIMLKSLRKSKKINLENLFGILLVLYSLINKSIALMLMDTFINREK